MLDYDAEAAAFYFLQIEGFRFPNDMCVVCEREKRDKAPKIQVFFLNQYIRLITFRSLSKIPFFLFNLHAVQIEFVPFLLALQIQQFWNFFWRKREVYYTHNKRVSVCNACFIWQVQEYRVMGSKKRSNSTSSRRNGGESISGKVLFFIFLFF